MRRLFEVNSEPHTGARPSVRLCVGVIKPLIKNNVEFYEVMWKGYKETTNKQRDELLKDVPKIIHQFEKKNKINFYKNENKRTGEITTRFLQGLS